MTEDLVRVGRVGRPHGLDGSFVVEGPSDDPERFAPGATLLVGGREATVVERKRPGGRVVIRVDVAVERGAPIEVPRAALPALEDDAYYVFELVGLAVEEEGGRPLGSVADVLSRPANDVLELDNGVWLPLVEDCVREVDLGARRIVVARGFADPDEAR